jgi:hypothetical protein
MNNYLKGSLFSILFLALLVSCSLDAEYYDLKGMITKIDAPDTVQLNQKIYVNVTFNAGADGCATYPYLKTSWLGNEIVVEGRYYYPKNADVCPQYIPSATLSFSFVTEEIGEIILRANDESGIADTIQVVMP